MKSIIAFLLVFSILLLSCKDLFVYNPNEIRLEESEKNLNQKNIEKILQQPAVDTLRFVTSGDTQRFYEEVEDFVAAVNSLEKISFVVINGDISDFGLSKEFKMVNNELKKLHAPYIGVIGNHDMLANGRKVYNEMFGPENFSFSHNGGKFIFLNTNAQEVGYNGSIPDLTWLDQQLSVNPSTNTFVFSHIPPFDYGFGEAKASQYVSMMAFYQVRFSIHGHLHSYSLSAPYNDGVQYLVTSSMSKRNFVLVTVANGYYETEQVFY